MRRLFRILFWLVVLSGALVGTSYVGARARAAMFLGSPLPELGPRVIEFNFDGASQMPGNPRAWVFTYGPGQLPGTPRFQIFVSATGQLIGTLPRDLRGRIDQYQSQRFTAP